MTLYERVEAALANDPDFLMALDDLSVEVSQACEDFCGRQLPALRRKGFPPDEASVVIALVMGWMIGFHDEDNHESSETKRAQLGERLKIAAFAAGVSHVNSEAVARAGRS